MIKIKVSCVLQFVDDYTEKVITDAGLRVEDERGRRPLRKDGGYYVFCGAGEGPERVTVSSSFYRKEEIPLSELGAGPVKIRLKPGKHYPLPEGAVRMEGRAPAGTRVGVVFTKQDSLWRLLYDYDPAKDGEWLELYHPSPGDVTGMQFLIAERDGKKKEFFRVAACEGGGRCKLEKPLSGVYKKAGSQIYAFYETVSGGDGIYFLPLRVNLKGPAPCSFYLDGEERAGSLDAGNNRRDF